MKISVLTPSYNSGKYIKRAIESVLKQDYHDFEHIIMDAGSEDNTIEILKTFPHLKWVSEKDQGQSDAMNKAFNLATGDVIVYLNADDYFLLEAFKKVAQTFKENKNIDVVIGNLYFLHNGNKHSNISSEKLNKVLQFWIFAFPLNPVSYFYKKEVQQKIGPFPLENHYTMDYWFLLRMYSYYRIFKIEEFLGVFDMHEESKSSRVNNLGNLRREVYLFLKEENKEIQIILLFNKYLFYILKKTIKRFL